MGTPPHTKHLWPPPGAWPGCPPAVAASRSTVGLGSFGMDSFGNAKQTALPLSIGNLFWVSGLVEVIVGCMATSKPPK
jgi:hypothetical protein